MSPPGASGVEAAARALPFRGGSLLVALPVAWTLVPLGLEAHRLSFVGIEHEKTGAEVVFTRWELIDLSKFRVRLKAEFEGSNADIYREEAVVAGSAKR